MTIIYISDFDLRGSGYMNIAVSLCSQLSERGYDVIALGLGYSGQEHYHPFKLCPVVGLQELAPMVKYLKDAGNDIEAVIVALDIPLQEKLLEQLNAPGDIPYIGLFPLEAGPLCAPWALSLLRMDARLIMSKFGQAELTAQGVDSTFIPIGLDFESWRVPTPEERQQLRQGLGAEDGTIIVLTVADNQERKNLSRSLEIFADFAAKHNAQYWMVTRPNSPVGWKLEDYAMGLGIMDRLLIWPRGISFKELWSLYAAADVFLLTSKAEGLAMPVLEAMACRLPVVGTKCAAIEEHLSDGRGLMIEPDYVHIDPWGNSRRYLAGREDGLYQMQLWKTGMSIDDHLTMLDKAQAYVSGRTWDRAGAVLEGVIKGLSLRQVEPVTIPILEPEKVIA